jgi:uncharacterized protein
MGNCWSFCRFVFDICMIPIFPIFKKLEQSDKDEIEQFVKKFEPYSDFNFVSMWVYDTKEIMELSWLNNNLVVKFQDYLTTKPFYSLLGESLIKKTVKELVNFSKEKLDVSLLKLIPEVAVDKIKDEKEFTVIEDLDNDDYLVRVEDLVKLEGGRYMSKRNHIHKYVRNYGKVTKTIELNLGDKKTQDDIVKVFLNWETGRGKIREDTMVELNAIGRLFELKNINNILCMGIMINNLMVGFSICELLNNNYAIYHFEKADVKYNGIFSYLKQQTAEKLSERGVEIWNLEQDLGDVGLRTSKTECRPVKMLKKYIVSLNG